MTGSGLLIPRERNPLLLVLSGPSGSGKDSLIECLGRRGLDIFRVVTVTTRPPRPGEIPGRDYVFVSAEEFERLRAGGQLLEYAQVYGHWYGTPKEPVRQALARGQDVLLRADVQGARAAGVAPVLLDRDHVYRTSDVPLIRDLRELLPLLERMGNAD